eukprot:CAMPEP_0176086098 /NCGR_PEP_ID=MMETSP0120_2-20121206/43096_1 /TAXON_ID=160619 /ORGANISM="Kryptoperidinium foliaceum, Strain CCMP 1326" /LENGTH=46 /DNA_ID= /DNA_START= /DNA_END= /DNA_ORIENTATION=
MAAPIESFFMLRVGAYNSFQLVKYTPMELSESQPPAAASMKTRILR